MIVIKLNDELKAKMYGQNGFLFVQASIKKHKNIWKKNNNNNNRKIKAQ